ncbi:MAG: undecaprenyl/decaprenyl-phosphate alpha-N-acetylglucosaminyl 1-phosphate transferase [Treponema sp.]|nr:undecaprenyl/decaprenyl-phosphate alpha-N-acetylglucosaminyl 1-phosphate transferase [Treponema sp.]
MFSPEDYYSALPIFIGGFIIFLAGTVDDFLNLRAKLKFVIQIIAALIVSLSPLYFHSFLGFRIPSVAGRVFTFLWILGLVNAYNLIDGLDWLCGGLSFLTMLTMGFILTSYGKDAGNLYFILGAAIAGFLVFNKPPAKIFLGDGGSQTLGYFVAVSPLFNTFGAFEDTKIIVLILLTSIPVTDVIAAVWRRKRDHRAIFSADRAHIHHKLVNIGFSKITTVGFLLTLQFLICLSSLGVIFMRNKRSAIVLLFVALSFVYLFFITIHYINRAVNIKMAGHLDAAPQEEH